MLNDLDEDTHQFVELCIGNPEFMKLVYKVPSNISPDIGVAYYVQFMCAHASCMWGRGVLRDNEWMEWMKNAFR